jgi:hypothetical protein
MRIGMGQRAAPFIVIALAAATGLAQAPPYDVRPPAEPPVFRVRYEASTAPGGLIFPVTYTAWIPPGVQTLRGVIVHQHGCGEGSCSSGLTGAYDLHWQALARAHDCALVAPAYEQPDKAECQMWCDPRNGSAATFQRALVDLGAQAGHPELATVPWALWGHSGGGHWAGGMALLHPERTVAAWLRSGVPLFAADAARTHIKPHDLPVAALGVPLMCNPGTKEGLSVSDNKFKGVWPANQAFFTAVRSRGGLVGVAVDPLTSHECGNQRYLAIPWLDACLAARLPKEPGDPLTPMPDADAWLGPITGGTATPVREFPGDPLTMGWLPNSALATAWMQYVKDTNVADSTPPPAPTNLCVTGNELTWDVAADLQSGLAGFVIERDGARVAMLPEKPKNPFGRPLFQNLLYSDTPTQPLVPLRFTDATAKPGVRHTYTVRAVNTVGLESPPSAAAGAEKQADDAAPPAGRPAAVTGFLATRCLECHVGDTAEGALDLSALPPAGTDPAADRRWARIIERVESGEMPPAEAEAPNGKERHAFTAAAGDWLRTAIRHRDAAEGRVRGRQLTPRELERSLHALLGIDIPLAPLIPVEARPADYTTLAERQTVSVHRLESHLAVVDAALDEAFQRAATTDTKPAGDFSAADIVRKNPQARCREPEMLRDEAVVWANGTIYYGRLPVTTAREDGWYRFRLTVHGLNLPETGGVWSTVSTGVCVSSAPMLQFVTAFEALAEPREIEFETWLPRGHMLEIRPGDGTLKQARFEGGQIGAGEGEPQQVPGIAMTRLTMERIHRGPDDDGVRRLLAGDLAWERPARMMKQGENGPLQPHSERPKRDLARLLEAFAARAFRHPVADVDIAPILALATAALDGGAHDEGDGFAAALRVGYRAILCSPRFFYVTESPGPLDDHAKATRLSYFLTGGPPDERLSMLAAEGRLGDPAILVAEADRLLAGRGGRRFVEDFAAEWLDLDQIDFTEPDRRFHREFDGVVKHAMLEETHAFLEEMLRDDRPVAELVSADATYLNSRLARYYRIDGVTGDTLRRVDLSADVHRGGLLAQGAILKVTANGSTTSPVVRGAWIAERLLGMEIPPPPSGVPAIEPDIRGTTTIREQLAQHRADAACASCHRFMDPIGFALENFDPAGQWRTSYRVDTAHGKRNTPPVTVADVLFDGTAFADFEEFRTAVAARPEWLARSLAGHLLVYGTGARLSFADREAVGEIARQAAAEGHGMRSILHAVVSHPIFLSK